jgi:DNA-binding CsgD family transcriptional regulator
MRHDVDHAGGAVPSGHAPDQLSIRCGADLVHLVEGLYERLMALALLMLVAAGVLSVCFAELDASPADGALTFLIASSGVAGGIAALAWRRTLYRWLRYSAAHQLMPAAIGAVIVLVNGPSSPTWWIALALLFVVATVSSRRATLGAAIAIAASYLGGTTVRGVSLLADGDPGDLVRAAAIFGNALGACLIVEGFARFVLRLHRLRSELSQPPARIKVKATVTHKADTQREPPAAVPRPRHKTVTASSLTARQLEVALLLRDGLRQAEIAACLDISPRQVERLAAQARERAGVTTTSHLVALLVQGRFAPTPTNQNAVVRDQVADPLPTGSSARS